MTSQDYCARCRRPVPPIDSDEFTAWEANAEDDGATMICPGCITGEEQRQMDEDGMEAIERPPGEDD